MTQKKNKTREFHVLRTAITLFFALFLVQVQAQVDEDRHKHKNVPDLSDFMEIYRDTSEYVAPTKIAVARDSVIEATKVVTNKFRNNWFAFATVGTHSFVGDYSNLGPFKGTISPDYTVGVGKWFTPGVALKMEYGNSASRGYTVYKTGHYGYGDMLTNKDGKKYRNMKTSWWDLHISAILNLSRLIKGYEGIGNRKLMNQFMLTVGLGMVHHMGYRHDYGSDNELSAHSELQYSRFFTPAKRVSLDLKLRGIFYQTNFDLEYGQADYAARKIDCNLGIAAGFTIYLGKQRNNGWGHGATKLYQHDYSERDVLVIKQKPGAPAKGIEQGTITFYVFYPNNYSGRNDAPVVASANVHTMDYLAGGLYTQKRYADTSGATTRIHSGVSLDGLKTEDLPTEVAHEFSYAGYLPRGYEMLDSIPLSLSLSPDAMTAFHEREGFYYAPIYDGLHTWQYRIDDATLRQQLVSDANYAETRSFGINAHSGLGILRENMRIDDTDELVSFADVYAAVNGNEGYISRFADPETVERIKDIFNNGVISVIQTEGMATSQDNYSGANAEQVGEDRNNALSENRSASVLLWLQKNPNLKGALTQTFISSGKNTINTVNEASTRGLNAKLNRGVKVRIHYMKR